MKRGRKATPTIVLERRGSWRAKGREEEPKPEAASSTPPDMGEDATAIWGKLFPVLAEAGMLTEADTQSLARYCRLYVAWSEAMAKVEKNPTRAYVLNLSTLDSLLRRLEASLGLTPSDRVGLATTPTTAKGKDRFFA